jgi:hypothetical protein
MKFTIWSLVSAFDSYQSSSFALELDIGVSDRYQGLYGKCHVIIYYFHILEDNIAKILPCNKTLSFVYNDKRNHIYYIDRCELWRFICEINSGISHVKYLVFPTGTIFI